MSNQCPNRMQKNSSPTLVEIAVILAIVGVLLGLVFSPSGPTSIGDSQLNLTNWDASTESPPKQELEKSVLIEGEWTDTLGRIRIKFSSKPDGTYAAQFFSSGRCGLGGSVQLARQAVFDEGVILLARPVQTRFGDTFQRLYAVRSDNITLLVPSAYVEQFNSDQSVHTRGILARE